MARQEIILGTAPNGLGGDPPRTASTKINAMTQELYSVTSTLGSAATRAVQTTMKAGTNELLVAGFNGIGVSRDLRNTIYVSGQPADLFSTGTCIGFADGGALGIPGMSSGSYGVLHSNAQWVDATAGSGISQTFEGGLVTWRRYPASATAWRAWEQVGGVVTGSVAAGAIMERGSTSSGQWTRFANGLLTCWTQSISATFTNSSTLSATWVFPSQFLVAPTVTASLGGGDVAVLKNINGPHGLGRTQAQCILQVLSRGEFVSSDASGVIIQATAIGWWK